MVIKNSFIKEISHLKSGDYILSKKKLYVGHYGYVGEKDLRLLIDKDVLHKIIKIFYLKCKIQIISNGLVKIINFDDFKETFHINKFLLIEKTFCYRDSKK